MELNNQTEPVRVATEAARALGRSPNEPGVLKLADALASFDDELGHASRKLIESMKPEPIVSTHPAETPVRMALLNLQARTGAKSCKLEAERREDGQVKWWASAWFPNGPLAGKYGDTVAEAVEACATEAAELSKRLTRENTIRARIEKELAEADAAEAALKATAPLEFRADGSPADALPIVSIGPFGIGGKGQREVKP